MNTSEMVCEVESTISYPTDSNLLQRNCCEGTCIGTANATLDHQDFCLNHFLLHCYERLEAIDPRARTIRERPVDRAALRAFIEECSRKTLEISLHCKDLSNFQRSRLLDILIWAGDLYLLLRAPRQWTLSGFIGQRELLNFGSVKFVWDLAKDGSDVKYRTITNPEAHIEQETAAVAVAC